MFHDRLKQIRKAKGFTAQEISDSLETSLRNYRKYESGDHNPPLDMLVKIADLLDISIDYLLCRDEFLKNHKEQKGES